MHHGRECSRMHSPCSRTILLSPGKEASLCFFNGHMHVELLKMMIAKGLGDVNLPRLVQCGRAHKE